MHEPGIEPSATESLISYFAIKLHVLKMGVVTNESGLPESNRRPFDNKNNYYSQMLYQLS